MDAAIENYNALNQKYPSDLNELVKAELMKKLPTCPSGGKYSIVGSPPVTKCSIHGEFK
jgi:hypothetical protein